MMLNLVKLSSTLLYLIHFEVTAQGSLFHMHTFRNSSAFKRAKGGMPQAGSVCHVAAGRNLPGPGSLVCVHKPRRSNTPRYAETKASLEIA
jgi:hypothetical protein